jgi:aspartyl-tRNA(Asn)/glutamyl-tRNA(Gln) amidotransferase subunit B
VRDAIAYESRRQVAAWQEDHEYQQGKRPSENRGWNADKGVTEFQRGKEAAHDYRYFPDPDLAPVEVGDAMLDEIGALLPELPIARRQRFVDEHGLSPKDAETIVGQRATADLFEKVLAQVASACSESSPVQVAPDQIRIVTKQFLNVWLRLANDRNAHVTDLGMDAQRMAELARITADGTVNKSAANRLAEVMLERGGPQTPAPADAQSPTPSPTELAQELGLIQVKDTAAAEAWVEQAFTENQQAVQDARKNPKKAKAVAGFLRGRVMKLSGGKADPKVIGKLIEQRLGEAD